MDNNILMLSVNNISQYFAVVNNILWYYINIMKKNIFPKRLRELRTENILSQQKLALIIGISQQAVFNWEKGITQPNIETLIRLAELFKVSIDYLVGYSNKQI